ncbi:MAG: PLDc N-terminal domain-containing protein [Acidimicrobiales bacterium]
MLAYTFPLLSLFWSMLMFAGLVLVVFFIIWCFVDNFRRKDHSAAAKGAWTIIIILIPLLGALIYVIARPAEASYEE